MSRNRLSCMDWTVIACAAAAVAWVSYWATQWYGLTTENGKKFSPGDLGSSINIAIGIVTIVLGYFAWRAYQVSALQLRAMELDQIRQLLERTLSSAIADYVRRLRTDEERRAISDREGGSFKAAYNRCIEFSNSELPRDVEKRFGEFRTANYIIKPLTYWCTWLTESRIGNDPDLQLELKACAHRMLSAMESACQVYIIMAEMMQLHELEVEAHGYSRRIAAHHPIHEFLTRNAHDEFEDCKNGNPSQFRVIGDLKERVNWHTDDDVRQKFFGQRSINGLNQGDGTHSQDP